MSRARRFLRSTIVSVLYVLLALLLLVGFVAFAIVEACRAAIVAAGEALFIGLGAAFLALTGIVEEWRQ